MMIKKGDIVYHKGLVKRRGINNACEFKVTKVDDTHASVELVVPADDPFDVVGDRWSKVPVKNLIKVKDYHGRDFNE